jgi:hypothetical protein
VAGMDIDWNTELVDQLDWHWRNQLRPRFDGLTDAEYFWEPVADCWSIRPDSGGAFTMDDAWPPPEPRPVTTIAWRLAHIIGGVLSARTASHFGGPPAPPYAGTAAAALDQLDSAYAAWTKGVRELGAEGLGRACGPAEGPFARYPLAALVLHINRETIHHGAEVALLRDLYSRQENA